MNLKRLLHAALPLILVTTFIFTCKQNETVSIPDPSVTGRSMKNSCLNMMPSSYNELLYVADYPHSRIYMEKMDVYKKLKGNSIYLDFKYKMNQEIKIGFLRYNFNVERFFDLIEKDFVIGSSENSWFITASIKFSTKILYSLFNILKDTEIDQDTYKDVKYYSFYKMNKNIYYSIIDSTMVVTLDKTLLREIISEYKAGGTIEKMQDIYDNTGSDEIYYYKSGSIFSKNKYMLLPDIEDFAITWNVRNHNARLAATPTGAKADRGGGDPAQFNVTNIDSSRYNYEHLKLLPYECSLTYNNNTYSLSSFVDIIYGENYYSSDYMAQIEQDIEVVQQLKDNVTVAINQFNDYGDTISPEFTIISEFKKNIDRSEKDVAVKQLLNILSHFTGGKEWNTAGKSTKYQYYIKTGEGSSATFSLIIYKNLVIFTVGSNLADQIVSHITNSEPSLYDRFYKKLDKNKDIDHFFALCNIQRIASNMEPIMKNYITTRLDLSRKEYNESFGELFKFLNEKEPVYINLAYNQKSLEFEGTASFVK